MGYYKDIASIEIALRKMLIKQSELEDKRVFNGRSFRGIDLNKVISDNEEFSITLNDLFILFDLYNDGDLNFSEEVNEDTIRLVSSFTLHITIYGTDALDLSQKLKARLDSEQVLLELQTKNIHLKSVSSPEDVAEYINDTFWNRYDIEVKLEGERLVNKVEPDYAINEIDMNTEYSKDDYDTNIKN